MRKLNYRKTFLLGFGFFAISITWSVYNSFIPKFLDQFISNAALIGFIMTFDNYFALFIQPTVGHFSDRIQTPFGKRMPFIIVGMPIAALFIFLLPNYFGLVSLIAFILIMNISMSIFRTPVISLMPDLTYEEHRSKANSIINFMGGIGALIAFFVGAMLWNINQKFPFYLAGMLVAISFIVLVFSIKEKRDVIDYEDYEKEIEVDHNFFQALKDRNLLFVLSAITCWFIAYNGIESFFTLYVEKYLGYNVSEAPMTLAVMSLSFLLFAIPSGLIGTKIGKARTIKIGLVGGILTFLSLIFVKDLFFIRLVFFITGFFWSLININSYPLITQMSGKSSLGTYTGLYYLFSSIAFIISPLLLGTLIDFIGYEIMFSYSFIFFILSFVLFSMAKIEINKK